jgi:hypothetical protein
MIQTLTTQDGRHCAIFTCDICAKQITDAEMALAVHRNDGTWIHKHKGACDNRDDPKHDQSWDEFTDHLVYLIINSGTTLQALGKRARLLSEIGEL